MQLNHDGATAMLLEAGATLTPAGHVLIPRELVERARATAPPVITVYDRDGEPAMELGGYNSYFGTGSDLMSTYDLETGEHRPSVLEDVRRAARLCDALPNIDFVMSSAHPTDQDPHLSYLLSFVRHAAEHDEAAGDDGGERARPGRHGRDRARPARRRRRASAPSRTSSCTTSRPAR